MAVVQLSIVRALQLGMMLTIHNFTNFFEWTINAANFTTMN